MVKKSSICNNNAEIAREMHKIENLEREFWQAWDRSVQESVQSETKKTSWEGKDGSTAAIKKKSQKGDVRFLQGIQWCGHGLASP